MLIFFHAAYSYILEAIKGAYLMKDLRLTEKIAVDVIQSNPRLSITIALTGIAIELLSFFVKRITKSAS